VDLDIDNNMRRLNLQYESFPDVRPQKAKVVTAKSCVTAESCTTV
jgi:hypothetical protein